MTHTHTHSEHRYLSLISEHTVNSRCCIITLSNLGKCAPSVPYEVSHFRHFNIFNKFHLQKGLASVQSEKKVNKCIVIVQDFLFVF